MNSPLAQFEVISLFTLISPLFSYWTASLTNFSVYAFILTYVVLALHIYANNESNLIPSRWSVALEALYASLSSIVKDQLGREIYLPAIYSVFLFVLISSLIGNIPYTFTLGTSLMASIGLSTTIIFGVTIMAISIHGVHSASYFVPAGTPLALVPLLVLIEFVSYAARAVSLGVRLKTNGRL